MKISLVSKYPEEFRVLEQKKSAEKMGVELEIVTIPSDKLTLDALMKQIKGDVVIWNNLFAPNKHNYRNTATVYLQEQGKVVLNAVYINLPLAKYKYYQSVVTDTFSNMNSALTIIGEEVSDILTQLKAKHITFPIIAKPTMGSKGNGIYLVKSEEEFHALQIPIEEYIFQNFIENDGDYRIFAIGGVPCGMVRRVSSDTSFLNNLSQGGSAHKITNRHQRIILQNMASEAATLFQVHTAGVDVMFEPNTGKYYFQEINSIPNWAGSYAYLDTNIADSIIKLAIETYNRRKVSAASLVEKYYYSAHSYLGDAELLWAWVMARKTGQKKYSKVLQKLVKEITTYSEKDRKKYFKELFERGKFPTGIVPLKRDQLADANHNGLSLLLLHLVMVYVETGISYAYIAFGAAEKKVLVSFLEEMNEDASVLLSSVPKAIAGTLLSLYGKELGLVTKVPSITKLLTLVNRKESITPYTAFEGILLTIYIFYPELIHEHSERFCAIFAKMTAMITHDYFRCNLSTKLTHTLLAPELDRVSGLDYVIYQEAEKQLSAIGNFIIDPALHVQDPNNSFIRSMTRSMLFVLASKK